MKEVGATKGHGTAAILAAVVVIGLLSLVIYVGALGPLIALNANGRMSRDTEAILETVYSPIAWAARWFQPLDDALSWYVSLWVTSS